MDEKEFYPMSKTNTIALRRGYIDIDVHQLRTIIFATQGNL